jgi:hypothetical protein
VRPGQSVLEIGTGTGGTPAALAFPMRQLGPRRLDQLRLQNFGVGVAFTQGLPWAGPLYLGGLGVWPAAGERNAVHRVAAVPWS